MTIVSNRCLYNILKNHWFASQRSYAARFKTIFQLSLTLLFSSALRLRSLEYFIGKKRGIHKGSNTI